MNIVETFFVWTGTRFYMDWLLPTNPKSKNILVKTWARTNHWTFGLLQSVHSGKNARKRFRRAYFFGVLHVVAGVAMQVYIPHLWLLNVYGNVYPVFVQAYVGYRCWVRIQNTDIENI
jgi:hypothetical protein